MRIGLIASIVVCAACACRSQGTEDQVRSTASSDAQRVVEEMVDAYNRHDAKAAAGAYASDVRFYDFPDKPLLQGREAVHTRFQTAFRNAPEVKIEVAPRIVHGRFVVDQENISQLAGGKIAVALWIYEVRNGEIVRAWRLPEPE